MSKSKSQQAHARLKSNRNRCYNHQGFTAEVLNDFIVARVHGKDDTHNLSFCGKGTPEDPAVPTPLTTERQVPWRPLCSCACGCRRRPGRRITCRICKCQVGPGCCQDVTHQDLCHLCAPYVPRNPPREAFSVSQLLHNGQHHVQIQHIGAENMEKVLLQCEESQLYQALKGNVASLAFDAKGCRLLQRTLELLDVESQVELVCELNGIVTRAVCSPHGNYVLQKFIELIPGDHSKLMFIVQELKESKSFSMWAEHEYGCRVSWWTWGGGNLNSNLNSMSGKVCAICCPPAANCTSCVLR